MKKILLNSLYVLVTLLSLATIYLFFIFNPNDYKEHITKHISSKAKYDVIINGDIKVSYYPDIKVLIPDIQVFNIPSNSYKQTITSLKNMKIEVSLIDLSLSLEKLMNKVIDVNYIRAYEFKYHGVNVDDVLMKTYSLLKLSLFSSADKKTTNIKNMSAKVKVIEGNMMISDIYIETEIMEASGNGSIDILTKEAAFSFIGKIKPYEKIISLYQANYPTELVNEELPIVISGTLDDLSVSIDLNDVMIKKIEPIKEKIIDKIQDKVIDELRDKIKLPF